MKCYPTHSVIEDLNFWTNNVLGQPPPDLIHFYTSKKLTCFDLLPNPPDLPMLPCLPFLILRCIISLRSYYDASFVCSFYTFSRMPEVKEIIVVCDPSYQDIFEGLNTFFLKIIKHDTMLCPLLFFTFLSDTNEAWYFLSY